MPPANMPSWWAAAAVAGLGAPSPPRQAAPLAIPVFSLAKRAHHSLVLVLDGWHAGASGTVFLSSAWRVVAAWCLPPSAGRRGGERQREMGLSQRACDGGEGKKPWPARGLVWSGPADIAAARARGSCLSGGGGGGAVAPVCCPAPVCVSCKLCGCRYGVHWRGCRATHGNGPEKKLLLLVAVDP